MGVLQSLGVVVFSLSYNGLGPSISCTQINVERNHDVEQDSSATTYFHNILNV